LPATLIFLLGISPLARASVTAWKIGFLPGAIPDLSAS
jgi:hypothetical protein